MRGLYTTLLILFITNCRAQVTPTVNDLNNLVTLGRAYTGIAGGANKAAYIQKIDSGSPLLNHMADALIAIAKHDNSIIDNRFLARPSNSELQWWYALGQINYKYTNPVRSSIPDTTIVKNALAQPVNVHCLLANYYAIIDTGIAISSNGADLSRYNFDLDKLGLKDSTEKAIFYLCMVYNLQATKVSTLLNITNAAQKFERYQTILNYCNSLPKFNGLAYHLYLHINFPDFNCEENAVSQPFSQKHIGGLYSILVGHYLAILNLRHISPSKAFYFTTVLNQPGYFEYALQKRDLTLLYKHLHGAAGRNIK